MSLKTRFIYLDIVFKRRNLIEADNGLNYSGFKHYPYDTTKKTIV